MPVIYTIAREENLIRATATGVIRAPDLRGLVETLLADPNVVLGIRALYDSRYGVPDLAVIELAEIATKVRQLLDRGLGRIAIVAIAQLTYTVAKTFVVLAKPLGVEVEVFQSLPQAMTWLREGDLRPGPEGSALPIQ